MEKISVLNGREERISGILHTSKEPQPPGPRRLAIICHGWIGHKNYLFQPELSASLPFDSVRIDFAGNGDSEGTLRYGNFDREVEDLRAMVAGMRARGYKVDTLIGHSRGAAVSFLYATRFPQGLLCAVNISGFYALQGYSASREKDLNERGFFEMNYKLRTGERTIRVTKADWQTIIDFNSLTTELLAPSIRALTIHGMEDTVNDPKNASSFANNTARHTLVLLPGADHNLRGFYTQVCNTIVNWLRQSQDDPIATGIITRADAMSVPLSRIIPVEGMTNMRDVGGYPTCFGGRVRSRYLFRGDVPYGLPPAGLAALARLGLDKCFDLRSDSEFARLPPTDIGCTRVAAPVFAAEDYSPAALMSRWHLYTEGVEGFGKAYIYILKHGATSFRQLFTHILQDRASTAPLLIHCTAGKDRTGIAIMLFLLTAGVDDEVIAWDYGLTDHLYNPSDEIVQKLLSTASNPMLNERIIREALGARPEYMQHVLGLFREQYGSAERYWVEVCGFTPEEVRTVRQHLQAPILSPL